MKRRQSSKTTLSVTCSAAGPTASTPAHRATKRARVAPDRAGPQAQAPPDYRDFDRDREVLEQYLDAQDKQARAEINAAGAADRLLAEVGDHAPPARTWQKSSARPHVNYYTQKVGGRVARVCRKVGNARAHSVFDEADPAFRVSVWPTRSGRYIVIRTKSLAASETWIAEAGDPAAEFRLVVPRAREVLYTVEHGGPNEDYLWILHSAAGRDMAVSLAPVADPGDWSWLAVPCAPGTLLTDLVPYRAGVLVRYVRALAAGVLLLREEGTFDVVVPFPEPAFSLAAPAGDYGSDACSLTCSSLVTPPTDYRLSLLTGECAAVSPPEPRQPRPGEAAPGEAGLDDCCQTVISACSEDGAQIPITLAYRRGATREPSPLLLVGYGAYGFPTLPAYRAARAPLLRRGFVVAIAHVRGGAELGAAWHADGRRARKMNSFADYLACARHLLKEGWAAPGRLIAYGASAGGLLVGTAANFAPELFGGVVASRPFVDPLCSLLDPSRPLTEEDWDELGNPRTDPRAWCRLRACSPVENIHTGRAYPPMLATAGAHDDRVSCAEPAKWVAKLQATARGGPFRLLADMAGGHQMGPPEEAHVLAWICQVAGVEC